MLSSGMPISKRTNLFILPDWDTWHDPVSITVSTHYMPPYLQSKSNRYLRINTPIFETKWGGGVEDQLYYGTMCNVVSFLYQSR